MRISKYLDNAPPTLVKMHKERKGMRGWALLGALLCNRKMERAWNIIHKSIKSDEGYRELWQAIVSAKLHANRGFVTQANRRKLYTEIAETAQKLSGMIAEPQNLPPDGSALSYSGNLDLQAYELLPKDVAKILGAPSWAKMKSDQRSAWAYSLLPEWPTMVELLDQLSMRARQCAEEKEPLVERDRGRAKMAICIRELYCHFQRVNPKFTGFAAIAAITSISMENKITGKTVRTVIFGSSGRKLPIKRKKKLATNE